MFPKISFLLPIFTQNFLFSVRSFGTEDRPTDRPVAPRDEVYEYIIFRGTDIKDIRVCQPPKPQPTLEGGLPNDPAIVQVRFLFVGHLLPHEFDKIFFSSTPPQPFLLLLRLNRLLSEQDHLMDRSVQVLEPELLFRPEALHQTNNQVSGVVFCSPIS